jgi:hypothetical protein
MMQRSKCSPVPDLRVMPSRQFHRWPALHSDPRAPTHRAPPQEDWSCQIPGVGSKKDLGENAGFRSIRRCGNECARYRHSRRKAPRH